ncbi:putative O-methyltransferase [Aspergillus steynii IBT 23096]|uniref:Putative O-methyltransferase n=1 Tax=Aspergillus steynii IBT 23096 TaxID=1392250 RepID=A0A2I2GSP1_9EURO|nr:putative O-methyltransferase [Aspergillus steynii IBT 23096]PLB55898.1 putative O-methyltransferase [Aspergillus steynii IBT 23096]
MSDLRDLARNLSQGVERYADELDRAGCTQDDPNLTLLGSKGLAAREDIIMGAEKTLQLARGPVATLIGFMESAVDLGAIQTLIQLGVPEQVPFPGSITYAELAKKLTTPISPDLLQRLVRLSRLHGCLDEDAAGAVTHTPVSAIFVTDANTAGQAKFMASFGIRPCAFLYESVKLDPSGENPRRGPLAIMAREERPGIGEGPTFFEVLEKDATNQARWHDAMAVHDDSIIRLVAQAYDWGSVQSLVDIGGSEGHVATVIANSFPDITITVQDRPEIIARARSRSSQHPRVSFVEHDFFTLQPLTADAYFLRLILHDWNDADSAQIVRQIIPAMREGTRLLIMDAVLPEPREEGNGSVLRERQLRRSDIGMFTLFSAKERSLAQMRELVEGCDGRLRFLGVTTPLGSHASLMSWVRD